MNQSKELRRMAPSHVALLPNVLEDRMVLSAGEGSTFAIMPGTVTDGRTGLIASTSRSSRPCSRSPKKNGNIVIGIDIAPATSATSSGHDHDIDASSPKSSRSRMLPATSSASSIPSTTPRSPRPISWETSPTSAVLVTLKVPKTGQPANDYSVQVKGLDRHTGTYLVGFYLPGDVAGTGTVTKADIQTIKQGSRHDGRERELQLRCRRQPRRRHQRART